MYNMDSGVPGIRKIKPVTKQDMERLKKGGIKADAIKRKSEEEHSKKDVPEAEKRLEEDLKKI
jgi:hypothetical protein